MISDGEISFCGLKIYDPESTLGLSRVFGGDIHMFPFRVLMTISLFLIDSSVVLFPENKRLLLADDITMYALLSCPLTIKASSIIKRLYWETGPNPMIYAQ